MTSDYEIVDTSAMLSPSLVVFREILHRNLKTMIRIAGDVNRLRPHCKTHKMVAVTKIELLLGITKHKCATFAEAEMLADAGVKDIFLAYNLVGPNIARAVAFLRKYPDVEFFVTADDPAMIDALSRAMSAGGLSIGVLLDCDSGQHRTGVAEPQRAVEVYRRIAGSPGIRPAGIHLYDGQNHQRDFAERTSAVLHGWKFACELRDRFQQQGWAVPKIVCGGTGSFPVFAQLTDPAIELSPGTCVFHDCGYGSAFPEMDFHPAALMFTRVVSRPTPDRITCDLGYKAVASDPPKGQRVEFPDLPDAEQVLQNEEHLVLQTPAAGRFQAGDGLLAIPRHICPTSALHQWAYVVSAGKIVDRWPVTSRDRQITI
ncbi:MAG: D-TA family PLP-dependent enzyme [Planctomycetaceae bacterium]